MSESRNITMFLILKSRCSPSHPIFCCAYIFCVRYACDIMKVREPVAAPKNPEITPEMRAGGKEMWG